jgi:transcriptional regulator with XRE-family HTH domain
MTHKNFAEIRRSLRISQHQLGRRIGISQGLLSNFELGYTELRPKQMAALENALRLELAKAARGAERMVQTLGTGVGA